MRAKLEKLRRYSTVYRINEAAERRKDVVSL